MSSLRRDLVEAIYDAQYEIEFEWLEYLLQQCRETDSMSEAQACLPDVLDTGNPALLRLFLRYGCDPNGPIITLDKWNPTTPLIYTIKKQLYGCAKRLLKAGADPNMHLGTIDLIPLLWTVDNNLAKYTVLVLSYGGYDEDWNLCEYARFVNLWCDSDKNYEACFAAMKANMIRQITMHFHTSPRGWIPETHHLYTFVKFVQPPKPLPACAPITCWKSDPAAIHVSMSDCAESLLLIVTVIEESLAESPSSTSPMEMPCTGTPLEVYYDLLKELGWMSD